MDTIRKRFKAEERNDHGCAVVNYDNRAKGCLNSRCRDDDLQFLSRVLSEI